MKSFWQINLQSGEIGMTIASSTPREAALKAATREEKYICLVEPDTGKLHVFCGEKIPLTEKEQNDFTQKRGITSKPVVNKMAYKNLKSQIGRSDIRYVISEFQNIMLG